MDCDQTCKDIAFNNHLERVYNCFGFGVFDTIFKIICGFILKMMLSLEPVGGCFSKLAELLFDFGDLDPIFMVTGKFSLKICFEPVDGFHLT